MNKKSIIQFLAACVAFILTLVLIKEPSDRAGWIKFDLGLLSASLIEFVVYIWENHKKIKLILSTTFINPNSEIRVSIAYLFRISINGKYFLVRNHRDQPGYQPVGGVYRYSKEGTTHDFTEIDAIPCTYMEVAAHSRNDLRLIIKKRKMLRRFLSWFESRKNREIDPHREFHEELVEEGLVSANTFPYIQYDFIKKNMTSIQRSKKWPVDEFLYADIFELNWENEEQKAAFEKLLNEESEKYIFATADEIKTGYTASGKVILEHSKKIL
ncbi:SMODS-associated NUDIX domain-containing protein [Chitinophaga arvensicola]|uniref:CD-NTase-associated protein 16 NUDIX domain-containing protein n=1 Tax=Chitinophaga arvensicola TaxID=29529 RepID=A0A1I0S7T6_9BACT|nr:hypothetical protein [Chitinophaga arvensicola]SEW51883.1 hypothetical protein SAMN04488122_4563 [Chitinophaga arvensicola]